MKNIEITSKQKAILIYKEMLNKKASDIIILDLTSLSTFTDFFIICNGHSIPHLRTLVSTVQETLKKNK
ncbi:MAG: RsfS/YbeB/iojap family protein [bacterium]